MQINVIYDPSVASAPAGFTTAIMDAVNYLDKVFTNPISITIDVGYGEVDGFQLASNALGESYYPVGEPETYSAVVGALKAENAPGASTLPSNSPFPANYFLYLSPAETKALGLPLSVPVGGVDGYVGFSSAPNIFGYANGSAESISGNLAALSVADGTHTTAVPLVGIVTASDNHGTSLIPNAYPGHFG